MAVTLIIFSFLGTCIFILITWFIGYKIHNKNMKSYYNKVALNMEKPIGECSTKEKMMKLCIYRQTTYEFSAYAILVICIFILIGCIALFILANKFVVLPEYDKNPDHFLISLLSIRIGIALVVFFICQLLLRLYRYCLAFTSFYTGIFDALFIFQDIDMELPTAIDLFMIKQHLEPGPKSPTEEIFKILKTMK